MASSDCIGSITENGSAGHDRLRASVVAGVASKAAKHDLGHVGGAHLRQLSVLQRSASDPAGAGDEQVEHRPAQGQAAGLAWAPAVQ